MSGRPVRVVVVVALVLGAAACGGDDDTVDAPVTTVAPVTTDVAPSSTSTTSVVPPTTAPPPATSTTTPPTTSPAPTTTSTVVDEPVAAGGWSARCDERLGTDPLPPAPADGIAPRLVSLPDTPQLEVRLPMVGTGDAAERPVASVHPVPGGLLVSIGPGFTVEETAPASWLTVIDDGGAVRWRRCLDSPSTAYAVAARWHAPTTAWQISYGPDATDITGFDLTTGADVGTIDLEPRDEILAVGDRDLLIARPGESGVDELVRLDLVSGGRESVPIPDEAAAADLFAFDLVSGSDGAGDVIVYRDLDGFVRAAHADVGWITDVAVIDALAPVVVREDAGLTVATASGTVLWRDDGFVGRLTEGFHVAESAGVVVANRCLEVADDGSGCAQGALVGLDTGSGDQLWELPDFREVPIVADGRAVVSASPVDDGYVFVDLRTGVAPADVGDGAVSWPAADAFETACCGEGEYVWVGHAGDVAWSVDGDRIGVWYPPASGSTSTAVDVWR